MGEQSYEMEYHESESSEGEIQKEEVKGKRKAVAVSDVPKLIDNKLKHLEKRLTPAQRDQKLLEVAKEDTFIRRKKDGLL